MTVSRRTFIKGLAASGAAMTVSTPVIANSVGSSNTRSRPENAPNLLIVFPDEMRAHALQFMGEDPSITPNLRSKPK